EEARPIEGDGARFAIDALNGQAVVQPPSKPHHLHVPQVAPRRQDVAGRIDEMLRRAAEKVPCVTGQRFDAVLPLSRQACAWPAFAVDEELTKTPRTRLDRRDVHHPGLAAVSLAPATVFKTSSRAQN